MALAPQPPLWPSPVSVRRRLQWGFAKRVKKMWKSRGKTCAVIGCTNCDRDLKVWDESPCESHRPHRHKECPCVRPFAMHRFPRNTETRLRWIANLQRKDFVPGTSARVCSIHFVDGRPTEDNPYPTLHLETPTVRHKGRRNLTRHATNVTQPGTSVGELPLGGDAATSEPSDLTAGSGDILPVATYLRPPRTNVEIQTPPRSCPTCGCTCKTISTSEKAIQVMPSNVQDHTYVAASKHYPENQQKACQTSFTVYETIAPNRFCFYTGLSKLVFDELVRAFSTEIETPFTMPFKDQILLTLMRLRLGLMLFDLSFRFDVSTAAVSRIFCYIVEHLAVFARKYLVFWLPRETIKSTLPNAFAGFQSATCIVDCFELAIERPGNLHRRNRTYSHYKARNTAKVLHVIAPNGFIMFLSKAYSGRASDRFITQISGFLKLLTPGDEILADRGFTVSDLLPPGIKILMPSFSKGRPQISKSELVASRRLARVRIHVERSIRRMKCFRLLKQFPASIFAKKPLANNVLVAVAGICNLQPRLIRDHSDVPEPGANSPSE